LIVATAGHVDHGKTSLIKHLTGVDTDRLEEEKRRGLTIDLGFAYRQVTDNTILGFIDVPGHTRFINTMIAGVNGIDLAMVVVAADDGPMPQTLEHIQVLRLLGITRYVLVITKIDRVEQQRVDHVIAELQALVPECTDAVFPLSNASGVGVGELQEYLDKSAAAFQSRTPAGEFRLSIDRAFSLKGVGQVVTGTVLAGSVSLGDELELLPQGTIVRVRSLHVQDQETDLAQVGDRCAMNIVGAQNISRGSVLAGAAGLPQSKHLDARLHVLSDAAHELKHLTPLKLYLGTRRFSARVYFIDDMPKQRLQPGANALVQLILDEPLRCHSGDRFVIRDHSESFTLGGGRVIDPYGPKEGKAHVDRLRHLAAMEQASVEEALTGLISDDGAVLNVTRFCQSWNLTPEERSQLFGSSPAIRFGSALSEYAIAPKVWTAVSDSIVEHVKQWQLSSPQSKGIAVVELQGLLIGLAKPKEDSRALFKAILMQRIKDGSLVLHDGLVKTPDHKAVLATAQQDHWSTIKHTMLEQGTGLLLLNELAEKSSLDDVATFKALRAAAGLKQVCKLNDKRYALPATLHELCDLVTKMDVSGEDISVVNFKNHLGVGRKLAIEVLEYFDSKRFTQRKGEKRVIIGADVPGKLFAPR
jgi:selenocysteine-specific elongation factor